VPWPIMKTRLTKECREFGRHSLRPARRSFSSRDCCPNDLQQNPREGFSKTPRVSFEKLSARRFICQRLPARTAAPKRFLKSS